MLETPSKLIIYGDAELKKFVEERRSPIDTVFVEKSLDWFKEKWYVGYMDKVKQVYRRDKKLW